jgi:hypothetical protein
MLMRTALIVTLLIVTSCSTKPSPSPLFGPIPDDAGDLLAQICADTDYGVVEADPDLAIAKLALARNVPPPPGVEAIMCAPQDGPNPALNSLAFDHATRRLLAHAVDGPVHKPLLDRWPSLHRDRASRSVRSRR